MPSAVHPRLRGEHTCALAERDAISGSSPPTRGTPLPVMRPGKYPRFIPAYAGNTFCLSIWLARVPVHPRLRGEHLPYFFRASAHSGSSPPTRGTRRLAMPRHFQTRFIPAYAGNTLTRHGTNTLFTVHPRLRGEHASQIRVSLGAEGSSPPTRGTPASVQRCCQVMRFIPAYAGNTGPWRRRRRHRSVHPRLRGEHVLAGDGVGGRGGSSPPTRGTQAADPRPGVSARFIPAYAGNT